MVRLDDDAPEGTAFFLRGRAEGSRRYATGRTIISHYSIYSIYWRRKLSMID